MATRFPGTEENPTQSDYEELFDKKGASELQQWENMRDNHPDAISAHEDLSGADNESVKSKENNPKPWEDNTEHQEPKAERQQGIRGFLQVHKKKGPVGVLLTLLIGGAIGVSFLSPGLLMLHVTETITDALNRQFPTMEIRTSKVLTKKISNQALSGMCTKVGNIRCKYHSLNDRQLELLRKAGVTVNVEGSTIRGRHQVTSILFNDRTIDPSKLTEEMQNDARLRAAFKSAYNSKFAGFADKVFSKTASFLGVTKKPSAIGANTDEERTDRQRKYVNGGQSTTDDDINRGRYTYSEENNDWRDGYGNVVDTEGEANIRNVQLDGASSELDSVRTGINEAASSGQKRTGRFLELAHDAARSADPVKASNLKTLAGTATGWALAAPDAACNLYSMYRAVSFGAKTIRSKQVARFAMDILSVASMIRSGEADPEIVAYYANLLTKTVSEEVTDDDGNTSTKTTKSATDSFGYELVAYNKTGPLTPSAAEFVAGGGLGGSMTGISNNILSVIGGQKNAKKKCGIIKHPLTQAGVIVASVAIVVFTGPLGAGALTALAGSAALGLVGSTAISAAQAVLVPILADMAAGILIDDSTFGERAGDALVSGSGVMMSAVAGMGGNAPLRPEQAVAYTNTQQDVLAQYAEEERITRSPLDPTSPHTFMGKVVGQLVPYSSQMNDISSIVTSSFSVTKRSLATILTPSAFATQNTVESYTLCDDADYKEMKLATDPFCNPVRGIPAQYLDVDPIAILDYLNGSLGERTIDEDTGMPDTKTENGKRYAEFIDNCIDRDRPLGDSGENFDLNDGSECFIEESKDDKGIVTSAQTKAYWYIYQIDQRVLDGMENGYEIGGVSCGPSATSPNSSKMSSTQIDQLMATLGLPAAEAETSDGVIGYNELLEQLKGDPKASWAAQQMLDGEKAWKATGGDIKEYMNTAWLWFENGASAWPDPYSINCNDEREGYVSEVSFRCGVTNFQVAGYQAFERRNDYKEVFSKLYSEDDLTSVLQGVVDNGSKASQERWDYKNANQQKGLVVDYLEDLDSITLDDISSPTKGFFDAKTQFFTLMLGKDPAVAAGLNSFAVTDTDVVQAFRKCETLAWAGYVCGKEQLMANMMMALYLFDGAGHSSSTPGVNCGSGDRAFGSGEGIEAVWGGKGERDLSYGFGYQGVADWYGYGASFGTSGSVHTGTDIPMDPYEPVFSPVEGVVVCERNGVGPGSGGPMGPGCAGAGDYSGPNSEWGSCRSGHDSTKPNGAGTIMLKVTKNGEETGDILVLGHMAGSLVKVGETVKPNQQVGTAGCMNGWHTHVEYYIPMHNIPAGLKLVDPVEYL